MDIKAKIEELLDRVRNDEELQAQFLSDPITAVEQLLGVDLPNEQLQAIVDGIKAKITLEQIGSALNGLSDLFGK